MLMPELGDGSARELQDLHPFLLTMIASGGAFTSCAFVPGWSPNPIVYLLFSTAFAGLHRMVSRRSMGKLHRARRYTTILKLISRDPNRPQCAAIPTRRPAAAFVSDTRMKVICGTEQHVIVMDTWIGKRF